MYFPYLRSNILELLDRGSCPYLSHLYCTYNFKTILTICKYKQHKFPSTEKQLFFYPFEPLSNLYVNLNIPPLTQVPRPRPGAAAGPAAPGVLPARGPLPARAQRAVLALRFQGRNSEQDLNGL